MTVFIYEQKKMTTFSMSTVNEKKLPDHFHNNGALDGETSNKAELQENCLWASNARGRLRLDARKEFFSSLHRVGREKESIGPHGQRHSDVVRLAPGGRQSGCAVRFRIPVHTIQLEAPANRNCSLLQFLKHWFYFATRWNRNAARDFKSGQH